MTQSEIARALGISRNTVNHLHKKGMPLDSTAAAQAWRMVHAKPRKRKGKPAQPSANTRAERVPQGDATSDAETHCPIEEMVARARTAEHEAFDDLQQYRAQATQTSPDELSKLTSTYTRCRQSRMKAEQEFLDWRQRTGELLSLDEAQTAVLKGLTAVRTLLAVGPQQLSPRLHGQPLTVIQGELANFCDRIMGELRRAYESL